METFGVHTVGSIAVIAYLVGKGVKASPWNNDHIIPIVCGFVGGLLGLVGHFCQIEGFPATDVLTSVAVGIVSGLSATGADQIGKQLTQS